MLCNCDISALGYDTVRITPRLSRTVQEIQLLDFLSSHLGEEVSQARTSSVLWLLHWITVWLYSTRSPLGSGPMGRREVSQVV